MNEKIEFITSNMFGIIINFNGELKTIEKYYIAEHLANYGGSFMKHIGHALHHADSNNAQIILNTWKEAYMCDIKHILSNQEEDYKENGKDEHGRNKI